MNILEVKDLTITVAHKVLCDKISFTVGGGSKTAIIANNGAGKSTLLKTIAGQREVEDGEIKILPRVELGYLAQDDKYDPELTVLDTLFTHNSEIGQVIRQYEQALSQGNNELLPAFVNKIDELQGRDYETNVRIVIDKLQLHDILQRKIAQCSGGELKRLSLARVLIDDPDFLILDEPTNHLDVDMIEWLETYLKRSTRTILFVTHDRYFLERVCEHILELDDGQIYSYPGNYSKFLEVKQHREITQDHYRHHTKQILKHELEWMRKAPRARGNKSVLRTKKFLALEDQYKAIKRHDFDKQKQIEFSQHERRIGGKILKLENISKAFGDKQIVDQFSYDFRAGERVGLVGKNGVGKSTFINMLAGEETVDQGTIKQGDTITLSVYQQKQQPFDESLKVIDVVRNVSESINIGDGKRISASRLLERFLFSPRQQQQWAYTLSGGEKRRLHLLTILIANPNFLILDEPTNDFDILTLSVLEDFLQSYGGCLVVVSHDRFFMDRVVDHLLVFEGQGIINEFPGSYTDRKEYTSMIEQSTTDQDDPKESEQDSGELLAQQANKKKSLSNKEREEYQQLGVAIETYEQRLEAINLELATGQLDHQTIKQISKELADLVETLAKAEERWLELEARR